MIFGRFLLGLGGESFIVANTTLLTNWFKGKELSLAFGISMTLCHVGSISSNIISPQMAQMGSPTYPIMIGIVLCVLDLFCLYGAWSLERRTNKTAASSTEFQLTLCVQSM